MRKFLTIAIAVVTLAGGAALATSPAEAAGWGHGGGHYWGHGGGWHGGYRWHGGYWRGGVWVGPGWGYWGPACGWRWDPYWGRYVRVCY